MNEVQKLALITLLLKLPASTDLLVERKRYPAGGELMRLIRAQRIANEIGDPTFSVEFGGSPTTPNERSLIVREATFYAANREFTLHDQQGTFFTLILPYTDESEELIRTAVMAYYE